MNIDIKNQLISRTATILRYIGENKGCNIIQISRELKIDYNFVSKIIQNCEKEKLLECNLEGRQKQTQLTKKGSSISTSIKKIEKLLYD